TIKAAAHAVRPFRRRLTGRSASSCNSSCSRTSKRASRHFIFVPTRGAETGGVCTGAERGREGLDLAIRNKLFGRALDNPAQGLLAMSSLAPTFEKQS